MLIHCLVVQHILSEFAAYHYQYMLEPHATLTRLTCVIKRMKGRPWSRIKGRPICIDVGAALHIFARLQVLRFTSGPGLHVRLRACILSSCVLLEFAPRWHAARLTGLLTGLSALVTFCILVHMLAGSIVQGCVPVLLFLIRQCRPYSVIVTKYQLLHLRSMSTVYSRHFFSDTLCSAFAVAPSLQYDTSAGTAYVRT